MKDYNDFVKIKFAKLHENKVIFFISKSNEELFAKKTFKKHYIVLAQIQNVIKKN